MTVLAFRPRPPAVPDRPAGAHVPVVGTFRSPTGRTGRMEGWLRVQRLVVVPRGAFVTGVFTGQLRDIDGSLIGVVSRRATVAADVVREDDGSAVVVRPFQLDLMGLTVDVEAARIDPEGHVRPPAAASQVRLGVRGSRRDHGEVDAPTECLVCGEPLQREGGQAGVWGGQIRLSGRLVCPSGHKDTVDYAELLERSRDHGGSGSR